MTTMRRLFLTILVTLVVLKFVGARELMEGTSQPQPMNSSMPGPTLEPTADPDTLTAPGPPVGLSCETAIAGTGGAAGGWFSSEDAAANQEAANAVWNFMFTHMSVFYEFYPAEHAVMVECRAVNPTFDVVDACSQGVGGIRWIVNFNVTWPGCDAFDGNMSVKATYVQPPGNSTIDLDEWEAEKDAPGPGPATTPAANLITLHDQCGGQAGDCADVAKRLGRNSADFCVNADYPDTWCGEGAVCTIGTIFYRQCVAGTQKWRCPTELPQVARAELMSVGTEAWSSIVAAEGTQLPEEAGCDPTDAIIEPLSGCKQGDDEYTTAFRVSFRGCGLFTTVDANIIAPTSTSPELPQPSATLISSRVAPYNTADYYIKCTTPPGGEVVCDPIHVFQQWDTCGGNDDGTGLAEDTKNTTAPWTKYGGDAVECAFGTTCVNVHVGYWQCQ